MSSHTQWWPTAPALACLLACLAPSTGCSKDALRLYCGAGLRPPVTELAHEFVRREGVDLECDYRGSEVLLSTIELTGRGDLYLPGDARYVELATERGLVARHEPVCFFVPAILVRKGNPRGIKSVADLVRPGLRVGLGDPEACAVGRAASEVFAKNDVDEKAVQVSIRTVTVGELANHVKLGSLDAAVVWDAIAAFHPDETEIVSIPLEKNVVSTVPIAILRSTTSPQLAADFVEFITSDAGRSVFAKHGYSVSLPPGRRAKDGRGYRP